MKKLSMTVTNVDIELITRVILHVTYSQYIKELTMSVVSVTMELLGRIFLRLEQGRKINRVSMFRVSDLELIVSV